MNVSELSDVEVNRAMIWCYGPMWICSHEKYRDQGQVVVESALTYLTDYNLTMPLAVEHGVSLINERGAAWAGTDIFAGDGLAIYMENDSINKNPLRAISEVLIKIAMEKKG